MDPSSIEYILVFFPQPTVKRDHDGAVRGGGGKRPEKKKLNLRLTFAKVKNAEYDQKDIIILSY